MSSPDRQYTISINGRARIHTLLGVTRGDVDWFVVQLEYNMVPTFTRINDWRQVVRFDHRPDEPRGHDIRLERLHLDIYRDKEKVDIKRGFPPISVNEAPAMCEDFLKEHSDYYISQFEKWHGIKEQSV